MGTPADQLPFQQQSQSPLDAYMQNYGARLQSLLAGDPNGGADPTVSSAGSVSNLGPDMYQPSPPQVPQQSALASPGGAGAGPQGPAPSGGGQGAPQAGAQGAPQPDAKGDKGLSFRDLWNQQDKDTRQKYLDQLQNHLKQTNETIDSAYQTMMKQLGGRPNTSLSRSDKGMLLMEFGLRMMEHSQSHYGQTNSTAGAIGQSGVETLGTARGLIANKQAQQQKYDTLQQQLTIAQGKEKAQLASRSALEEGRDVRAFGQQNSMLERTAMQQQGAGDRNDARIAGAAARTDVTEAGKNQRASNAAGQVKRTVTGDDGSIYGVTGNGSLVQLGKDGKTIKANPGGGSGGGKLTAAQANYNLYMSTNGKDKDGNPLQGEDLQAVQQEALKYAANPRTYQLSEPQMRQMAEKSADSFIRANPTSWLGMSPDEVAAKRSEYAEGEYNRLQRGGPASPVPPARPRSALEGTGPTGSPARGATGGGRTSSPAGNNTTGQTGSIPTQVPQGGRGPNAQQLALLNQDPQKYASYFLQKFGYLPREYQQFAKPQSALGQ